MKIPLNWLKEYVDIKAKPEEVAELLTMSGTAIEGVEQVGGCDVLEAEITTNRPDCLSLLGIASELAAVTHKELKKLPAEKIKEQTTKPLPLAVHIEDKQGCPGYTGRVLDEVRIGPSPAWLLDRIRWMGLRSVNNVVDITNYVLFETGQPLHAFDYDKLKGGQIIVRRAKKGETIVGIDDVKYALDERILVIADAERPVAIAGVMGGKETEISGATKRIALESARFDPMLVRRAVRLLKLASDSSYRFERSIDPEKVIPASDRCTALCSKLAGSKAASPLKLAGSVKPHPPASITLSRERLEQLSGDSIPMAQAEKILKTLGFKVLQSSAASLKVQGSSLRADLTLDADLIEEIVRIYGFDKIPSRIPVTRHVLGQREGRGEYGMLRRMKSFFASRGFWETVTFSLVSEEALKKTKIPASDAVKINNPLSKEQEYLRPSGLPGLLGAVSHNVNRKEKDLKLFEVAKRFSRDCEENVLTLAITGTAEQAWDGSRESSFYLLKGAVENLFAFFKKGIPVWAVEAKSPAAYGDCLSFAKDGSVLGCCAAVSPAVLSSWDISAPVYYAEILLDQFLALPDKEVSFRDLPRFPAARRDIAFVAEASASAADIEEVIRAAAGAELKNVSLFDEYSGKNIPKGKRSLAFSLQYQKEDATFTEEEINRLHDGVVSSLKSRFGIELR